ncbi:MAG TPA: two-component system regulatory protein YycI [Candidatus Avamphibacillus intestinigallinarum]|nr:two-component system regulatory protein YycI [Candidatus Avamphibacillus intestinigallinarum]
MQWGQIKTLFILCFLILNVYLFYQFIDKQNESDLRVKEAPDSSIETKLKNENIKVGKLPQDEKRESFISVKQRSLSDKDKKELDKLQNQTTTILDDKQILSSFDKPIEIPKDAKEDAVATTVKQNVWHGDEYSLWNWNKDINMLVFFQKKKDQPVFFNQSGVLLVFLNDKNEIISYTQTLLGDADDKDAEKKDLIKSIKAVETLYKTNELQSGDEITNANIGFYTRLPFENGVQVFVPTWKITVNDERHYFVNALEGYAIPSNEAQFLTDTLTSILEKLEKLDDDHKQKEPFIKLMNDRLTAIEKGQEEE